MTKKNVTFNIHQYADICTCYLPDSDHKLILDTESPNHLANTDTENSSIFYTPDFGVEEAFEEFSQEAHDFGFSDRFIEIIKTAWEQNIPYVRFDSEGGHITGIEPWPEEHKPAAGVIDMQVLANPEEKDDKPFKVRILWGSESYRADGGDQPVEYSFATDAELNAFLLGAEESNGFLDYKQIDPNPDGSWPEPESEEDEGEGEEEEA